MKNVYAVIFVFCAGFLTFVPKNGFTQCLCSGGLAPSTITYEDTLSPTNASSSTVIFPQFDPSLGTLGCVGFVDTISGVTTTTVWNLASSNTQYKFLLTVANNIAGPGVSVNEDYTRNYGPDSLNAMGDSPGDSITYGPDSLFTNVRDSNVTSNVVPYLGTGTVDYSYTLNGGLISLEGSLNYGDQIITNYWGTFKLTYYWCSAGLLATFFNDFTAARNGAYIQLKWTTENEQKGIGYEIQYSTDGAQYFPAGNLESSPTSDGNAAPYGFLFSVPDNTEGSLYFRIKRTSSDGKSIVYSPVRTVGLLGTGISSVLTYPNPAVTYSIIEFDQVLSGDFNVQLVSITGQVLENKVVSLSGNNQIRFDFTSHPATGLYYIKVKDYTKDQQFITKLIIE